MAWRKQQKPFLERVVLGKRCLFGHVNETGCRTNHAPDIPGLEIEQGEELMMALVKVIETSAVSPGKMKAVKVEGKDLLVVNVDGDYYVLDNKCPHKHLPLSRGKLEGCVLTCAFHRAQFDVKDGSTLADPRLLFLKMKTQDAIVYPVTIESQYVMVDVA